MKTDSRLSSNKSEEGRKKSRYTSPDIQEEYHDETEGLHSNHHEDEISEEEFSAEFENSRGEHQSEQEQ